VHQKAVEDNVYSLDENNTQRTDLRSSRGQKCTVEARPNVQITSLWRGLDTVWDSCWTLLRVAWWQV